MGDKLLLEQLRKCDSIASYLAKYRKNRGLDAIDLSGEDLRELDFEGANLQGADLRGADLRRVNLKKTNLKQANLSDLKTDQGEEPTNLEGAILHGVNLDMANCEGAIMTKTRLDAINFENGQLIAKGTRANLSRANLRDAALTGANFSHSNFGQADLRGARIGDGSRLENSNLVGADLRGARLQRSYLGQSKFGSASIDGASFYEADVTLADFYGTRGAADARGLEATRIPPDRDVEYFEHCVRSRIDTYCDWERIRAVGRLPLFAPSYILLFAILGFFYLLDFYNERVELTRAWAERASTSEDGSARDLAAEIRERLHKQPVPARSALMLSAVIALAAGSTIFALRCPTRVQQFSKDQWCDQLGKPLIHYWPFCWKYRRSRILCVALYLYGGVFGAILLLEKITWAFVFIFRNPPGLYS